MGQPREGCILSFEKIKGMKKTIKESIAASISVKQAILKDAILLKKIEETAKLMIKTFKKGGKVLFCGNGGSAADAQHLAAELSGRFYKDRAPLFAEALHVNPSFITAVANDYGYEEVFARMVQATGRKGDVLIAISTSGNSQSILNAVDRAKQCGLFVIGMTGESGGKMKDMTDILLNMPSNDTPRIQEAHILIGHILCLLVEESLFG
jgi:D-sedoheptulose 7-phosphate isomerase